MRIERVILLPTCLALLLGLPLHAVAQSDSASNEVLFAAGFMDGHPDLLYRSEGLDAYAKLDFAKAFQKFRKAAEFGDKASQAIVGEMLWSGIGVERDQVMALVWMDVAAEREYPRFVDTRNRYWNELTPPERQRARNLADNLYAQYGDAATEPRIASAMRRERSKMTGSRVGTMSNNVKIYIPGHGSIDGSKFYDPKYWDPKQYRAWHDDFWVKLRQGTVVVGEAEKLDTQPKVEPAPKK